MMIPNKLSPIVQALIALTLLAMFAVMMFLPAFVESFKVEADTKQTLFTLVTAVVFFFIGKNTDSAQRESQITAAVIGSIPVAPAPAPPVIGSIPVAAEPAALPAVIGSIPVVAAAPAAPVQPEDSRPVAGEKQQ